MTQSDFPVTLVFPPQGHFTQPYLALPCIRAWLEAHGFDDVEVLDASIEAYDDLLEPESLERAARRARERNPLARFAGRDALGLADLEAFRSAAETEVSAEALVERIADAKRTVRDPERFADPAAYLPAIRTIYHGLRLVSAGSFPSRLTPHNFTMRYANDRSRDVLAATRDELENPFLEWFRERLLPRLLERRPRVLGMSVIYGSQLIPALTLGRLVKEALPDCHVTAGGGFLAYIGPKLMTAPGIDGCLDSIVYHEGEEPMLQLCRALRAGEGLDEVGSLEWFDRSAGPARAVRNAPAHPIKLDEAPVPSFEGLPFERYFSPHVVLPYDVNRGCYYGECTFCTLPTVIGPGYRTRSAETIVDHALTLAERHGTRNFQFITDCMPPGMIRDLPDELLRRDANLRWWSDARVEPKAYTPEGARKLHASGCRKLLFGFETVTPRLLKMMQKGQSARATLEVARNCAEAGISVTFYAMVGFPSETLEEARATADFLAENADVVREVSLQTFHIDEVAQTYREPERFGIRILDDPEADLQLYHDYESEVGMTQTEAAEAWEEMMAKLRAAMPLFAGDAFFYFMQKSHYFLHLARDVSPDAFVDGLHAALARDRARREQELDRAPELALADLPFGYAATVRRLGHPLVRAVRPDFLTGRYVADAEARAAAAIGELDPAASVLAYDPERAEFTEITRDGRRLHEAWRASGSLDALVGDRPADDPTALRVRAFARRLHGLPLDSASSAAQDAAPLETSPR